MTAHGCPSSGFDHPRQASEILDDRRRLVAAVGGNQLDDAAGDHRADFEDQPAAGQEPLGGLGNEALDDLGAGGAGDEGLPRLVVLDLTARARRIRFRRRRADCWR